MFRLQGKFCGKIKTERTSKNVICGIENIPCGHSCSMKHKRISAYFDEIQLRRLFMNTGLHFAEEKIAISEVGCYLQ